MVLLTLERDRTGDLRERLPSGLIAEGVPSSVSLRPQLATLLTGRLPAAHGVRDPVVHRPVLPTLVDQLAEEGWTVHTEAGGLLHPGEQWGREASGEAGSFTWLHGEEHLEEALGLHADGGQLVVVTLGPGRLFWDGLERLPERVGHVDVVPTLAALLGLERVGDGVDLRTAEVGTLYTEDARGLVYGAGVRVDGAWMRSEAPVRQAAVDDEILRRWRQRGVRAGDPQERGRPVDPGAALDLVEQVELQLRLGRLRPAGELLERLEGRFGISGVSEDLRERMIRRLERPRARRDRLVARWDVRPAGRLRLAEACLDLMDYSCAEQISTELLADWSDHLPARRIRASAALRAGRSGGEDASWLFLNAPAASRAYELEAALNGRGPLPDGEPDLPSDWRSELLRARLAWQRGRLDEALWRLDGVVRERPQLLEPRWWRAIYAARSGDPRTVVRLLGPVADEHPAVQAAYAEATEALSDERERVEALRARWRQAP